MQRLQRAPGHGGLAAGSGVPPPAVGMWGWSKKWWQQLHGPQCVQFPRPPRQGFGAEPGGAAQVGSEGAQVLWVWWPQAAAVTAPVTMLELGHGVSQQLRKS